MLLRLSNLEMSEMQFEVALDLMNTLVQTEQVIHCVN